MIINPLIKSGGGGLSATIEAVSNLEVFCTDGTRSYTPKIRGNSYFFENLEAGTYTVSNSMTSEEVAIDKTALYKADLTRLYLYRNGDECTNLTGGWGTTGFTATGASIVSGTKQPTQLYLSGASSKYTMLGAINNIDLSAFSKVRAVGKSDSIYSSSLGVSLLVLKTKNITGDKWGFAEATAVGAIDFEVDIADATNGYIAIKADGATTIKGSFTEIWLE